VLDDTAVLDAWGDGGIGVRAIVTADELLDLLERLVREVAAAGAASAPAAGAASAPGGGSRQCSGGGSRAGAGGGRPALTGPFRTAAAGRYPSGRAEVAHGRREVRVGVRDLAYAAYERRLAHSLDRAGACGAAARRRHPRRQPRWAKAMGTSSANGHQRGADKIVDLLGWCDDAGVELVTLWLLSTDNLSRPQHELAPLLSIIEGVVADLARPQNRWTLRIVGALDLLPDETARRLKEAAEGTAGRPASR
jgi:hypothetical protein